MARTSNTLLNTMVIVNEHACLVPTFRGNGFGISSLAMTLPVGLSYIVFFN